MFKTESRRCAVAVAVAFSGSRYPASRLCRIRWIFPDIGPPCVLELGLLRYEGERSIVVPEATDEELQLPEGLTIYL